ncbi:MAG: hypothetical protein ACTSWG_13355 [Candidatus Helarchaeota archaeon]
MRISNRCIIVGGGSSIRENNWHTPIKDLKIWNILRNEVTIGLNFSYHWLIPTIFMFADYAFYHTQFEHLKKLPLLLTVEDGYYNREECIGKLPQLYFLKTCKAKKYKKWGDKEEGLHPYYWGKDSWKNGWYVNQLCSILALNFAINGLSAKEIFLLGIDACEINGHTHFYDDTEIGKYKYNNHVYYGVGKDERGFYRTGNYNKIDELNNFWYKPFKQEWNNGVRIWNVSQQSALTIFPQITYKAFYAMLRNNRYAWKQEELRENIKELIKEKSC